MTTTPALELTGLCCQRGSRLLFSGVDTLVPAGHLLRVRGDNGAGKTSLLRLICGLSQPDGGSVRWRGDDIATLGAAYRAQLVYLGHVAALKPALSALENLQAAQALAGLAGAAAATAPRTALAQAGLHGRTQQLPVRLLSQGQRKRAALARLAACAALPLWVLDEPFDALDAAALQWLQPLLAAQLARGGVVVLTSHLHTAWEAALPQVQLTLQAAPLRAPSREPVSPST